MLADASIVLEVLFGPDLWSMLLVMEDIKEEMCKMEKTDDRNAFTEQGIFLVTPPPRICRQRMGRE